jgi:hypothetical protein
MSKDDEGALDPVDEQVVEILLRTDRLMERYAQRKRANGDENDFDRPGMTERLLIAQIINQTAMAGAMGVGTGEKFTQEGIFKQLDTLRTRLFEEVKAYVEEIMTSPIKTAPPASFQAIPVMPSRGELEAINAELKEREAPDWETIRNMDGAEAFEILRQFRAKQPPLSKEVKAEIIQELNGQIAMAQAWGALEGEHVRIVPAKVHAEFEDVLFKASIPMHDAKRTLELLLTTPEGNDMLKLMVYDAVKIKRGRAAGAQPPPGTYMGPPATGG